MNDIDLMIPAQDTDRQQTAAGRPAEIPNSKSQIPNKFEIQNSKPDLESGTWDTCRGALLTDVGEPFEGNGDTNDFLGVVLDTYDSGRGFE